MYPAIRSGISRHAILRKTRSCSAGVIAEACARTRALWCLLLGPRGAEDVAQPVVAFVARVVERLLALILLREVHRERPGTHPRRRIVGGHRPLHQTRSDRPEALDQPQRGAV